MKDGRRKPPASTKRLRGRAGAAQRIRRLRRTSYLCEMCQAVGRVILADVVDHIVPLAHGGKDTDDNTRNLCNAHHAQVTAEQFGHGYHHGSDVDGRPKDPDHPWNR